MSVPIKIGMKCWPVFLLIGCATTMPVVPSGSQFRVESPDGLVVPVGESLRFQANMPVPADGWRVAPSSRDRATFDAIGTLKALRPGAIQFEIHVPGANNTVWGIVAAFDSPSTEKHLFLGVGRSGTNAQFVVIRNDAELDYFWTHKVSTSSPVPEVDFTQRSVVAVYREHKYPLEWNPTVFTHLEAGPPAIAHFVTPHLYNGEGIIPEGEGRLELLEIRQMPEGALIASNGRMSETQSPFYTPPPSPPPSTAPTPRPTTWTTNATVCVGESYSLEGYAFAPNRAVELYLTAPELRDHPMSPPPNRPHRHLGTVQSSERGELKFTFTVQEDDMRLAYEQETEVWAVQDGKGAVSPLTICPAGARP